MDEKALPLTSHLAELRSRVFKVVVAWALGAIVSWEWREEIFAVLLAPATGALAEGEKLQAIAPSEIFVTYLKCSLLAGFALGLPVIFWQIWAFVAPGLYPSEKKVAVPFVISATLLFVGGGAFGYYAVFPVVYLFFASFSSDFVESAWTMREVFGMTTNMVLAFGIAFELPIIVFLLSLSGVVDARQLFAGTRYAVVGAFILAAVLTPPDPVSQTLLAVPLIVLYLLGVGVAYLFAPRRSEEKRIAPT